MAERTLRILVAAPGHDGGAKVVARALADAGHEVVYTGVHQTAEMIAATAVQEAVDAVGLSIMAGADLTITEVFGRVIDALKARGAGEVVVFGGGSVPTEGDLAALAALGVKIFTQPHEIASGVEACLRPKVA